MFTHNLDPVLLNFGLVSIRWYSMAYIVGILAGWWYGKKLIQKRLQFEIDKFYIKEFDDLISYLIIAIILGGRIGYIIFYNPQYYILNPFDTLKVWEGGMSFHGALAGIIIVTFIFSRKRNLKALFLLDIIACVAPIGIFLGRIANFVNGELVGKISNVSWSVIFPNIDLAPRHPSQIYEAFLEGIVLFTILNYLIFKKNYKLGICSSLFLIYYGIFRIISEIFREPDPQIGYVFDLLSMGTILSSLMVFFGSILFYFLKKNEV